MTEDIFRKRPFKTRNADEYNLSDILSLFVNPINGLSTPIEYENSIIKGRMGSGKTMYLRANYAFYLFKLVPSLIENQELILPVFIRLSDFQHLKEPSEIYKGLVIKIVEELSNVYLKLQDAKGMANVHLGMKKIKSDTYFPEKIKNTTNQLLKLGSDEYVEKISSEFGLNAKTNYKFFEASTAFKKNEVVEIKQKKNPGINDIVLAYDTLIRDSGGKILILIDEAGSLDKNFFKAETNDSFFEIFMNQLRTNDFIRTKVAVYPNSYSDILTETRYGDVVALEENIDTVQNYRTYRRRVEGIIENYLNVDFDEPQIRIGEIFDCENTSDGDCIEELINGSGGNYRRLIQLLDSSMNESFKLNNGKEKVKHSDAVNALKRHSETILTGYTDLEKEYLNNLAKICKSRSTFRFKFPYNAQALYKYMEKSQEFNLIKVIDAGTGRKGTTYAFDYAYCILQDIPTHYLIGSERIDKLRSLNTGEWITRSTNINEEIIAQSEIPNKIEGEISFLSNEKGFVRGQDGVDYFFTKQYIIESDSNKIIWQGKKIKFNPSLLGDSKIATDIEVL
ncbi:MAG: hypothetical protein SFU91_00175 [Chloroherpetonaceae bacterium]|nr:hypothetical protein [Chloroherpetonaceae bacterium]